jgi:hypothetical protein
MNRVTGYTLQNDCANAVVSALPLTLMGDVWHSGESRMQDAASVFVFPFEDHLHDYGHVQVMLNSLIGVIVTPFLSYTSVFLFARRTERLLSASRRMAWDAELVLLHSRASLVDTLSARFACTTLLQAADQRGSCVAAYGDDSSAQEEPMPEGDTLAYEALGCDRMPLMVAVAVAASGV